MTDKTWKGHLSEFHSTDADSVVSFSSFTIATGTTVGIGSAITISSVFLATSRNVKMFLKTMARKR